MAEIIFDSDIVSLDKIIRVFFVNIDPFDSAGQFCDKGYSYKSALFSNDQIVIDKFNFYIDKIQENHKQKVETMILPFKNFYVAEEYHQDYYKKNPMATQSIKGTLYEEKILNLIKSKMQITKKKLSVEEADKLISGNNQNYSKTQNVSKQKDKEKSAVKSKKISKK